MINGQKEIWISTNPQRKDAMNAIAISNCGRLMRGDGTIEFTKLRQQVTFYGERRRIHRILADFFIPKTEEDIIRQRDVIDHITHNPTNMNVNDIRNLRWCTKLENDRFPERRKQLSNVMKGYVAKSIEEHYGKPISDIRRIYENERSYYQRHKKFRWE